MNISDQRRAHDRSGKALRRARYLFIFLHRFDILFKDDAYMDALVAAARRGGLYSDKTCDKSVRFSILRRLFKVHNPMRYNWYEWYAAYRWKHYGWRRTGCK